MRFLVGFKVKENVSHISAKKQKKRERDMRAHVCIRTEEDHPFSVVCHYFLSKKTE